MTRRLAFAAILVTSTAASLLAVLPSTLAAQQVEPWSALTRPSTRRATPTTGEISIEDLQSRVYRFSADSMQGRLMGTPGNVKGAEYIAGEVKRLGLEPAGENGTYFQTLPWMDRALDAGATITAGGKTFRAWTDFVPRDQGMGERSIDGVPVVYAGDFADAAGRLTSEAATGKFVIVTFSGNVPGNPPRTPNRGAVNQAYPGAAGIAIVSREEIPAATLAGYQQPSAVLVSGDATPAPVYIYITRPMAESILGRSLDGATSGTAGVPVRGTVKWSNTPSTSPARNVVAVLRGSDPALRNSYVAIGAHNDHIGNSPVVANDSMYVVNHLFRLQGADDNDPELTSEQQAQVNAALVTLRRATNGASARTDTIFNGADDDASGSMGVLEIAEYLVSRPVRPKRSIIFVWHVGEELGLFGSQYFTDHPTVPRDSIVAQLNVDMIGRGTADDITGVTLEGQRIHGGPDYLQVIGSRRLSTELGDWAEAENREGGHGLAFDYALDANGHPQNIYCRSDHYMYARYGIPIAFFTTGGHADYHQVTDEAQYIDYPHYARVTRFIAALGVRVANTGARPVRDKPLPDPRGRCQQ
jgi:Peptidase family M28